VGGGIAGLAVAHALRTRLTARPQGADVEITVLEKSDRPGGNIRTERIEGYTCEWGPNGFLDSVPETLELVRAVGIGDRLQASDERARRRFIFRRGKLHEVPAGPVAFLRSGLLSARGKARIACEPFAPARPPVDETIHAFASRRIGREAADVLIDPLVSGIFAGDARELSLQASFPKMWRMETDHGGLFRALLATIRSRRGAGEGLGAPAGRLTSFRDGMEDLIRAVAGSLGSVVRTRAPVVAVNRGHTGGFLLRVETRDGPVESLEADAVALCGPSSQTAALVADLDPHLASALGEIEAAPLVVVCLGYPEASLPRPLDGFGFLVPRGEGPRILGALWDSSIYPGRAPQGRALIRAMIGGAHDPQAVGLSDDALVEAVRADLFTTMGLAATPLLTRIFRHPGGIPQYTVGHLARLERIEARLGAHPGLCVAGNSYRGVAINSCIADAGPLADRILCTIQPSAG
jgi:oxygen-dependent protoporphyrinogen oxidase